MNIPNEHVEREAKVPVDVTQEVAAPVEEIAVVETPVHRTLSVEEWMEIYLRTEHRHENTYRELAK